MYNDRKLLFYSMFLYMPHSKDPHCVLNYDVTLYTILYFRCVYSQFFLFCQNASLLASMMHYVSFSALSYDKFHIMY